MSLLIRHALIRASFRPFRIASIRSFSLPSHIVQGLPALSPTMEKGTVGQWVKAEGDAIEAGDAICQIETDKATMDFQATDDMILAKILVESGNEVAVGDPICVFVEEEESVAAFADFTIEAAPSAPVQEEIKPPTPEPVAPVVETPPPTPEPEPTLPPAPQPEAAQEVNDASSLTIASTWGRMASKSPLANRLNREQQRYIDQFGSTGQKPIQN